MDDSQRSLQGPSHFASAGPSQWADESLLDWAESKDRAEGRVELSELAEQLNKMYGFFQKAVQQQRVRHTSELSTLLRKVDRGAKDTFRAVQRTYTALTDQVQQLSQDLQEQKQAYSELDLKYRGVKKFGKNRDLYAAKLEELVQSVEDPDVSEGPLVAEVVRLREELAQRDQAIAQRDQDLVELQMQLEQERRKAQQQVHGLQTELSFFRRPVVPALPALHPPPILTKPPAPPREPPPKEEPGTKEHLRAISLCAHSLVLLKELFEALTCHSCKKPLCDAVLVHSGVTVCGQCSAAETTLRVPNRLVSQLVDKFVQSLPRLGDVGALHRTLLDIQRDLADEPWSRGPAMRSLDPWSRPGSESTRPGTRDSARPGTRDSTRPGTRDSARPATRDSFRSSGREITRPSTRDSARPGTRESARSVPRDGGRAL